MSKNLDKANIARATKLAEKRSREEVARTELARRWEEVTKTFDSVPIKPRDSVTLAGTTTYNTMGDVLRAMLVTLSIRGYYPMGIEDAEDIAKALSKEQ
jgi:hypothetical protein